MREASRTLDVVCAAAEQLVDFHERFAPLFGKEQAQDHAYDSLKETRTNQGLIFGLGFGYAGPDHGR